MVDNNKKLEQDLFQLIGFGIVLILSGSFLSVGLLKYTEYNTYINFFSGVMGSILGYIFIRPKEGGYINFYLTKHTPTLDEKRLHTLIGIYSNKILITTVAILFIVVYSYFNIAYHNSKETFNLNNIFGSFLMSFICVMLLCGGVKYITAWWNIKRSERSERAK